jgi:predicted CXXCH cytochrome family protein
MCASCHEPHSSGAQKLLLSDMPNLCFTCHEESKFKGRFQHGPVAVGMCTSCHEPHQSYAKKLTIEKSPDLCFRCHETTEFSRKNQHPPVAAGMCTVCHDVHATPNPYQLHYPITDGCLKCHPKIAETPHAAGAFSESGHPLKDRKDPRAKNGELTCASCHNPHSSDHMKLFRFPAKRAFDLCINCHTNSKKR